MHPLPSKTKGAGVGGELRGLLSMEGISSICAQTQGKVSWRLPQSICSVSSRLQNKNKK